MEETEISHFLHILVRMGEALQNSGAEVFRVEDTLNRIAIAYGAEDVNVFVITSSIVVTLTMPSLPPQTETRRLRHAASNDLLTLQCAQPPYLHSTSFHRRVSAPAECHSGTASGPKTASCRQCVGCFQFCHLLWWKSLGRPAGRRHCRSDLLDGALSLAFLYEWRRISVYSIISQRCLHSAALPLWDAVSCR